MGGVEFEVRLRWAVDRLTIVTPQRVVDETGQPVYIRARPLLAQLRSEVHPSGQTSDGSRSTGPGAPLALDALVLLSSIEQSVQESYWLVREATRRPGVIGGYTLEERLRYTVDRAIILDRAVELCGDVPGWVGQIERTIDPPKVVPLTGHACPVCWAEKTAVQIEPGEFVDQAALTVTFGAQLVASCGECGARWPGDQMLDLAAQIGGDTQVMQHVLGKQAGQALS